MSVEFLSRVPWYLAVYLYTYGSKSRPLVDNLLTHRSNCHLRLHVARLLSIWSICNYMESTGPKVYMNIIAFNHIECLSLCLRPYHTQACYNGFPFYSEICLWTDRNIGKSTTSVIWKITQRQWECLSDYIQSLDGGKVNSANSVSMISIQMGRSKQWATLTNLMRWLNLLYPVATL